MENEVQSFYGNRLRARACGICLKDEAILMVNHRELSAGNFWSPPGGGIQFGEHATDCLHREFEEETGLAIEIKGFLFVCEFVKPPLHALELFFEVSFLSGQMKVGTDPEPGSPEIIKDVRFLSWPEIDALPRASLHGIFGILGHPSEIIAQRGFFRLEN